LFNKKNVGVLASIGVSLGLVVKQATGPTFNVLGKAPDGKYKPIEVFFSFF